MQVKAPPPMPAIHPNLAQIYNDKVAQLEKELADPAVAAEAKSVLRSMIKTIVISPGPERGQVEIELHGELAPLLVLGQGGSRAQGSRIQVSVVAGARNLHKLLFVAKDLRRGIGSKISVA